MRSEYVEKSLIKHLFAKISAQYREDIRDNMVPQGSWVASVITPRTEGIRRESSSQALGHGGGVGMEQVG